MSRIDQSVANLLNIIKEQDKQIKTFQLLAELFIKSFKGGIALEGTPTILIQRINDLLDYLSDHDIDYLVLLIPGIFPKAYDREEIDKAQEEGILELFIREQWKDETVALVI